MGLTGEGIPLTGQRFTGIHWMEPAHAVAEYSKR